MQKRCPKSTKNDPKIDPSASQGGVWLPGSIWLALDMPFLRCLIPKWLPKRPENIPVEPPMVPRISKMSHFPPNGRSGRVFWALRAAVHLLFCYCLEFFLKFSEELGWGGGGEHNFQNNDTSQHHIFLQHQNL